MASGRIGEVTNENGRILLIRKKAKGGVGVSVSVGVREGRKVRVGNGVLDGIFVFVGARVLVAVNVKVADKSGVNVRVGFGVLEGGMVSDGTIVSVGSCVGVRDGFLVRVTEGVAESKTVKVKSGLGLTGTVSWPLQAENKNISKINKTNKYLLLDWNCSQDFKILFTIVSF
jgi:hypothetical protein